MSNTQLITRIDGLFFGKVQQLWPGRAPSAIGKIPLVGPHNIDELGFTADSQADPEHHGGHDKAIHHYASDHYPRWIAEGKIPTGTIPAAFGENIASTALTEDSLCIGDKLRLGTSVVQISQGRQPCWKVSEHTGNSQMAYLFQATGRTGWYYRVLEPGTAAVGDTISLLERTQSEWSVKRVTAARLTKKISQQEAETLAALPELAAGWQKAFAKIADGTRDEDTSKRLLGGS